MKRPIITGKIKKYFVESNSISYLYIKTKGLAKLMNIKFKNHLLVNLQTNDSFDTLSNIQFKSKQRSL